MSFTTRAYLSFRIRMYIAAVRRPKKTGSLFDCRSGVAGLRTYYIE